jgi:hypothetical protein
MDELKPKSNTLSFFLIKEQSNKLRCVNYKSCNISAKTDQKIKCSAMPGVDVMITNFSDFLAKKMDFFLKTNVMIKILHNLAFILIQKRQFFAEFFVENIFKIIT